MPRRIKHPIHIPELEITDILLDGKCLGRHEGQVVFVEDVLPGDVAEVIVGAKEKKVLLGRMQRILKSSPDRVPAACKHFGDCGGCKWQDLDYQRQLYFKERHVRETLRRIGKVEAEQNLPILGQEPPFWYRNKLEFSFSEERFLSKAEMDAGLNPHDAACGFHIHGFYHKVLGIEECLLQKPIVNEIRNAILKFAKAEGMSFHNNRENTGFLRGLVFRTSDRTGELMLMLILGETNSVWLDRIFDFLADKFPQITSRIWMLNQKLNNSYQDLHWHHYAGKDHLIEKLGKWEFRISPTSFFQTNTKQAERLYDLVRQAIGTKRKLIYDLYTGAGSIAIYVNDLAEKIVGIEYSEDAVKDAQFNCLINGIDHLSFFAGDMKKVLSPELIAAQGRPEVVIADPPRAGMDAEVVQRILEMQPEEIVYVSCNPSTQARDLALLSAAYKVKSVQPVDMFPHTAHVESVAVLVRV